MMIKLALREIKTSLARYIAIFAIVALGVGFFAGLKDCKASMVSTARNYLDEHNMYDYQIASTYGIDDESVEIASAWDGVTGAEGSVQIDVMTSYGKGDSQALKAISLPDSINTLRVVKGRLPESPDECVVDDYSITDEGFTLGDSIVLTDENDSDTLEQFRYKEFKIVGTVNTPIYLDYQRGSTDIGNGSLSTFFYIDRDAFDVDYFTGLYVTLDAAGETFSDELKDELDNRQDSMDEMAESITEARRDTARQEAQDELDEKKREYEDKLAEYEEEKADAEKKIADAEKEIKDGAATIKSTRKKLNKTIKDLKATIKEVKKTISGLKTTIKTVKAQIAELNTNKGQIETALSNAEAEKAKLEQAYAAGAIDENTYNAGIAAAEAGITELNNNLAAVNDGLSQAKAGLKKATKGKNKAEAGLKKARKGLKQARAGLKQLDSEEKKLEDARETLAREKREAESEFKKARKKLDNAKDKLDKAQNKIDDMETGNSYAFSRNENAGYSSFDSNSSIVSNIARIFPVFFFLIAALVCMTTMTRMIDEQRTQIGVMKALGYSNSSIVFKYMFYSGSAALIGAVLGFFVGCKVFPAVIWRAYTMMYDFNPDVDYIIDPVLAVVSIAAALICSMGATWVSIAQDFKVSPSNLIRPKTPPAGKRILLERITPLWKRISFLYKVSIRNIFRDKKRFLMMVIGVSGCTALLIAGLGIRTSIANVADHQFEEISLYDFVTVFNKNMHEDRQSDFFEYMSEDTDITEDEVLFLHQGEVTLKMDNGTYDVTCMAADPERFGQFYDLHTGDDPIEFPGKGEVVIVRKINHDFGVKVGDEITIRDGYKEMKATVSGVSDNYVNDSIFMSEETYEKGFGRKPEIKSALVMLPDDTEESVIRDYATEAANYEYTAAVSANLDVKENVSKMMKSLDAVIFVVILSAALLAFIVLYNLTNINITERIREIATIKVLGFRTIEVAQYVFRENMFLTAIAALVGIPAGKWLLKFVIDNIVVKMIFFEPRLTNLDIVTAVILTFLFAILVNMAMQRRLRNVSMTESLKSVE